MEPSRDYKIDLKALNADGTTLQWHLDDSFFASLDEDEIRQGELDATLRVKKTSGTYELTCSVSGQVTILCDRCLEPMQQPIATEGTLRVRLGDTYEDDGDVITIPEEKGIFDAAWNLYEIIALALPIHHVHAEGECNVEMAEVLQRHSAEGSIDPSATETATTDERWQALRNLKLDEPNS